MNKAIYIATGEPESGKSLITLGLLRIILGRTKRVGYFRPIIENLIKGQKDNHIETVLSHFNLDMSYEDCYALTVQEVIQKKIDDQEEEIVDIIFKKYKELEERFDFILLEGTDFSGEAAFVELDLNAIIAKNLGTPVILVGTGKGKTDEELISNLHLAYDSFVEKEVQVLGLIANKVESEDLLKMEEAISEKLSDEIFVAAIPLINSLFNPTIKEIISEIEAELVLG
ncbi:MAG: AAA family ATPase, partial [Lutimonas sp.]